MNYVGLCWSSGTSEYWSSKFMKNIPTIRLKTVISDISKLFNSRVTYYNNFSRYDKLHVFVLFVSSPSNLRYLIKELMVSIWWNPLAFYGIIANNDTNVCDKPEAYLSIAWNLDLESCAFFCVDYNKTHAVYTFNRYGNPAPKIWRKVRSSIDEKNLTWSMLKHELQSMNAKTYV